MGAQWAPQQNFEFCPKKIVKEARWAQNFSIQWKINGNGYANCP